MSEKERRRHGRKDSLNLLDHIVLDENGQPVSRSMGRTLNISEQGLLLQTPASFEPEQRILVTVALKENLVEIKGRVRHVEPTGDTFRSGIEFEEIDDDGKKIWERYIEALKDRAC